MPLYEYKCDVCGRFEKIVQFSAPPLAACPTCGGAVQKLFSSPAIQFKGSGFYITDYAKKVSSESSDGKSSDQSSSDKSDKSGEKSSGEKSSGDKSSGDKSSGDSSSTSAAPAPAAKTSSKD